MNLSHIFAAKRALDECRKTLGTAYQRTRQDDEVEAKYADAIGEINTLIAEKAEKAGRRAQQRWDDITQQVWTEIWSDPPGEVDLREYVAEAIKDKTKKHRRDICGGSGPRGVSIKSIEAVPDHPALSIDPRERAKRDDEPRDERLVSIEAAMGALQPNARKIFKLSYYSGLSNSEIAERLRMPPGTVSASLTRSRWRIKEATGAELPENKMEESENRVTQLPSELCV
nr:hypothetical protein Hi04_10k_c2220_00027 [uncultured bacterium]